MSTTYKPLYTATGTAYTISPENVASSSTLVAGVESGAYNNTSSLYSDVLVSGLWTCGTTPTSGTTCQVWVVPALTDNIAGTVTWPDVFDGTASGETATSAGILAGCAYSAGSVYIDATTSNRAYYFRQFSIRALLGYMPTNHVLFVSHNSAVNSNTTAGNHAWYPMGINEQGV